MDPFVALGAFEPEVMYSSVMEPILKIMEEKDYGIF